MNAREPYRWLGFGIIALSAANILNDFVLRRPFWPITKEIYLGYEANVATWFSSILLASAAAASYWCFCLARARTQPARGWLVLAALLAFMSCDETAQLHEGFGALLSESALPSVAATLPNAAWTLVLGPVLLAVALVLAWDLRKHLVGSRDVGLRLGAGGALIFLSGVGLETTINWLNHDALQTVWDIEVILEETGEMAGAWLMGIGCVLRGEQLRNRFPPLSEATRRTGLRSRSGRVAASRCRGGRRGRSP